METFHNHALLAIISIAIFTGTIATDVLPNVMVIMTDEHNLRTLGCYRELMKQSQAEVWGPGVNVETPHLDSIASKGAIFSNFYTVSPVCTPSRGSFMTGTYPSFHGATKNDAPLNADAITFAQILQDDLGYETSYMGKWHLNGELHGDEAFGAPDGRSFGFKDTKYQWNRGHWKFIEESEDGSLKAFNFKDGMAHLGGKAAEAYTTDFVTDRAIKFINNQKDSKNPFALMLSFPDPHTPVPVREPYASMFDDLDFLFPRTAVVAVNKQPAPPAWAYSSSPVLVETNLQQVSKAVQDLEARDIYQSKQRRIFGMVKLLDDSIGRILNVLKDNAIEDNTIVVFTSDHGSTMSEHNSDGKGQPYKTSAGVPFMIQWPEKIPTGKLIETAYSSIDFAPTLLNLLGANTEKLELPGIDASQDLLSDALEISDETQTRFMEEKSGKWAAAVNQRFTFIISRNRVKENPTPWLLDSVEDPDEIYNYFNSNRTYREISAAMSTDLYDNMVAYDFQLWNNTIPVFFAQPKCRETIDQLDGQQRFTVCKDYRSAELQDQCENRRIWKVCPLTCNRCVKDSFGRFLHQKELMNCSDLSNKGYHTKKNLCKIFGIRNFCGEVCLANTKPSSESPHPSAQPSVPPPSSSPSNTESPSIIPSVTPTLTHSEQPSSQPSVPPPSSLPSNNVSPSIIPSVTPTLTHSEQPSSHPSASPSNTVSPSIIAHQ